MHYICEKGLKTALVLSISVVNIKNVSHTTFHPQRPLLWIPVVASTWTKAAVETTASAGTMTSRPTPVHSFGTEAVEEMTTALKQKTNARRLAFYSE